MSHTCEPTQCPLSMHFLKHSMLQKQCSPQNYQKPSNPIHIKELKYKCSMEKIKTTEQQQKPYPTTWGQTWIT